MRHARLTTTLVTVALAATACGSASPDAGRPGAHGSGGSTASGGNAGNGSWTARGYAAMLLDEVQVPGGAAVAVHAPSKALEHLPQSPALSRTPTVIEKFWSVDQSASAVVEWLTHHKPNLLGDGSGGSTQPGAAPVHNTAYRPATLPGSIGAAYLYVSVVSTGPGTSAIGAYAVTLPQQPRPAAENVPLDVAKVVISWSLAPGGTPVLKTLTGNAAATLARDFNALRVDSSGMTACPMIPVRYGDITVTFTGDGHTWTADIPACPNISVTRDGTALPSLDFGKPFLADVKSYTGGLPHSGQPRAPGSVIPLHQPAH